MFCIKQNGRYQVHVEQLATTLKGPRKGRTERLTLAMTKYSQRLEHFAKIAPSQWFNFYDFWRKDSQSQRNITTYQQEK
ncbi:hypothetical protein [Shewanella aestuarii]|uniref:hypothetical protein n=1 Tax=Shewanella aestuarii TaxID=1028752 RepID=UPI003D76D121